MKIKVTLAYVIPDGYSQTQIDEWLRFNLGANGALSGQNPMVNIPLPPPEFPFGFDWE